MRIGICLKLKGVVSGDRWRTQAAIPGRMRKFAFAALSKSNRKGQSHSNPELHQDMKRVRRRAP
jgi:hypothetical protein